MCESFAKEFYEYKQRMVEWKKQLRFAHSEEDFVFVGDNNTPIEPRVFDRYYDEVLLYLTEVGVEYKTYLNESKELLKQLFEKCKNKYK